MERIYFKLCNGEVGLTPATRAIMDAVKQRQQQPGRPYDMVEDPSLRLEEWRKNNVRYVAT
jgi:hypothetical protein